MPKASIRLAIRSLLLGFVVAIGVAWGCAAFPPEEWEPTVLNVTVGRTNWYCYVVRSFGLERVQTIPFGAGTPTEAQPPSYVELDDRWTDRPNPVRNIQTHYVASGWPFAAMCGAASTEHVAIRGSWLYPHQPGYPTPVARSALIIGPGPPFNQLAVKLIPLRPLYWGLAADWLAFAFAFAAVEASCRSALHWRRRSNGLCVRCAHPVGAGLTCPECGHRPQRVAA